MHTLTRFFALLAVLALAAAPEASALVSVGNVTAVQQANKKLVDIHYDITGIATPVAVSLEISVDGGATWNIPATSTTGAIGGSVTPGTNLHIVWDAGVDWNKQVTNQARFRVKVNDLLPDLAVFSLIADGNFTMGDTLDGLVNAPAHTVNVSAYYIGKKEVSKAEWDSVRDWALLHGYAGMVSGAAVAADHPVQTVSWYDAVKWCNARSEKDGLTPCYYTDAAQTAVYRTGTATLDNTKVKWTANGYRLPTEAEWEKAARGGLAGKRFPWGDIISHTEANFYNSGEETYQSGTIGYHPTYDTGGVTASTAPVGSFAANAYGLNNMAGNVAEWSWDWDNATYYSSSPAADPQGPASGVARVLRGGSWDSDAYLCRTAYRSASNPGNSNETVGFRTVRR